MDSTRNLLIIAAVVILVAVGGFLFVKSQQQSSQVPTPEEIKQNVTITEQSASPAESASPSAMMESVVVTITDSGFSPSAATVKVGESVTWINKGSTKHTVDSAVHPTHQVYPRLNLGAINPGESKTLSFPDAGTFKYHDHLNPQFTGSVTVQ